MIPSSDLRLASMIRAMEDVILPALGAHAGLAQEQAHILLGHLHVLRQQADHSVSFERVEAVALATLADRLATIAEGGGATMGAASALRDLIAHGVPADPAQVRAFTAAVSIAVEALIDASGEDGSAAYKAESAAAILTAGRAQSLRDRSWFAAMGFEQADAVLPAFGDLTASRND